MRIKAAAFFVALAAAAFAFPGLAGETAPSVDGAEAAGAEAEGAEPEVAVSKAERIDKLFDTLKTTSDEAAGKQAENAIIRLWLESGSDTVDLLMNWSMKAIDDKNYPLALDFLDRVIVMKPDYAEGWNKRATVHYLLDDYGNSLADISQVLAREPRHFGAISGFAVIMRSIGDDGKALDAYRKALALDPYLDAVKEGLDELEAKQKGEDT